MPETGRPSRRLAPLLALLLLPLGLVACGANGPTQVGAEPTHDWPSESACPTNLAVICVGKQLEIFSTINEPRGTSYGIASSDKDVFVICRWPPGAAAATCEQMPPGGSQVVGEAAVYRVAD
jgi:hypothetical protein